MEYQEIRYQGRRHAISMAESGNDREQVNAVIGMARFDEDPKWVENYLLSRLDDSSMTVRWGVIKALAELTRRSYPFDRDLIVQRLHAMSKIGVLRAAIDDAMDDINHYHADSPGL